MKTRLLIISFLTLFCTAFINAAGNNHIPETDISEIFADHISSHEISAPQQKLLLPRQSNFASQPQTRTVAKRHSSNRNSNRFSVYISGKPVDQKFIRTYQQAFFLFPTGLNETYRHFISLGKLII